MTAFESGSVQPRTAEQKRTSRIARALPRRVVEAMRPGPVKIIRPPKEDPK